MPSHARLLPLLLTTAAFCVPKLALAQATAPSQAVLPAVVVTGTPTEADALGVPASVDRVEGDDLRRGRPQVNISESLGSVPGLQARDRQNHAQDVQVSMRGFGARATFGIRGLRLYVDGIPATLPDGQGQITHADLASAERIEVLRGPFSALYGASSGGVLQVFTEEGRGAPQLRVDGMAGADGLWRSGLLLRGNTQPGGRGVGYVLSASKFHTDGWRDHSAADRSQANAKLTLRPHPDGRLTLVANRIVLSRAQDPLGLTRAQMEADPRTVDPAALTFDTRKQMDQSQAGLTYEHHLGEAHSLRLMAYSGQRDTLQFQSIPVATQGNPLHPGGVIDLARDYGGMELRWTWHTALAGAPLTLVGGLARDTLREHRAGYENFVGATTGARGRLRRDERNRATATDPFLQAEWQPAPRWSVQAGLRRSSVRFDTRDAYIAGPNPDDSGRVRFSATLPVAGVSYAIRDDLRVYAAAGRGFETPTLNELAYRADGTTGLNTLLSESRSTSVELGLKGRAPGGGAWTAALFRTGTRDEIVTQTSAGGRSTFQNAGRTQRDGLELAWSQRWHSHLRAELAYTRLDARYRDGFVTCAGVPCLVPTLQVPAGNHIPGLARDSLYASLAWQPPAGWRAGAEWRALSRVWVNDRNTDAAAGHGVASAYVGYAVQRGGWDVEGFVRVDNLLDKAHVGSVIVNEGNGRFFEPAPGRRWFAGVAGTLRF